MSTERPYHFVCPYVASDKKKSLKSNVKHIFHAFIHVYSPGSVADNPSGTKF